jgi:hypothetical protein
MCSSPDEGLMDSLMSLHEEVTILRQKLDDPARPVHGLAKKRRR